MSKDRDTETWESGYDEGRRHGHKEASCDGLRSAVAALISHVEQQPYRDAAGLRLGSTVPHFDRLKQAMADCSPISGP